MAQFLKVLMCGACIFFFQEESSNLKIFYFGKPYANKNLIYFTLVLYMYYNVPDISL